MMRASGRKRLHRGLMIATIAVTSALVVVAIAGDALLGTSVVTDGREQLDGSAWRAASRFAWAETGRVELPSDADAPVAAPAQAAAPPDLYFAVRSAESGFDLMRARWSAAGFLPPEPLFELNSPGNDTDPLPVDGGRALVFASDRDGGQGGYDLWIAERREDGFAPPRNLGPPLNSPGDDRRLATDRDGARWVLASNRLATDGVRFDLFETTRTGGAFSPPELITALVTDDGGETRAPALSPDGRFLVFASDRKGGGGYDLYRTTRHDGKWRPPERLIALSTAADEMDAAFSPEGSHLFFVRSEPVPGSGATDLVLAELRELVEIRDSDAALIARLLAILASILLALLLTLLYLGWERLHPFIKFIILSLIIHLLILLYVQTRPQPAPPPAAEEIRAYAVNFLGGAEEESGSEAPGRAATGDKVSAARAAADTAVEREATVAAAPEPAAPAEAQMSQREARRSDAMPAAAAPERSAAHAAEVAEAAPSPAAREAESLKNAQDAAAGSAVAAAGSTAAAKREAGSSVRIAATFASSLAAPAEGAPAAEPTRSGGGATRTEAAPAAEIARAAGERSPAAPSQAGPAREGEARQAKDVAVGGAVAAPSSTGSGPRAAGEMVRANRPSGGPGGAAGGRTIEAETPGGAMSARASTRTEGAPPPADPGGEAVARAAAPSGGSASIPSAAEPGAAREGRPDSAMPGSPVGAAQAIALGARSSLPAAIGERAPGGAKRDAAADAAGGTGEEPPSASVPSRAGRGRVTAEEPGNAEIVAGAREAPPLALKAAAAGPPGTSRSGSPALEGVARDHMSPSSTTASRREVGELLAANTARGSRGPLTAASAGGSSGADGPPAAMMPRRHAAFAAEQAGPASASLYAQRTGPARLEALKRGGGSEVTEAAVLAGLRYLRDHQRRGGLWGGASQHQKYGDFRIGKTGLALLAFLGSGYTQAVESEFSETVQAGIAALIGQQDSLSGHIGDSEGYGHGIATYALAEAYAMTKDAALERPLKRAVRRILDAQTRDAKGTRRGGWSYYYADPARRFDRWPRLSVSVWQVMALKSARIGGLEVPDEAFDGAKSFILGSHDEQLAAYRYNHDPEWLAGRYPTLPGSNSAALFALQLLGIKPEDPRYGTALAYVSERRPAKSWRRYDDAQFAEQGLGNEYYLYYATLGLFCHGGEAWSTWNQEMTALLVTNQARDGSWKPNSYYSNYAGDTEEDRIYCTAMAVLTLEVYYRYFTPLLGAMVKEAR